MYSSRNPKRPGHRNWTFISLHTEKLQHRASLVVRGQRFNYFHCGLKNLKPTVWSPCRHTLPYADKAELLSRKIFVVCWGRGLGQEEKWLFILLWKVWKSIFGPPVLLCFRPCRQDLESGGETQIFPVWASALTSRAFLPSLCCLNLECFQ